VSKGLAPGGAFSASTHQPAIGGKLQLQDNEAKRGSGDFGSPVKIKRMLQQIFSKEKDIKTWQEMAGTPGKRRASMNGTLKWVPVRELVGDNIIEAKHRRDQHVAELRQAIDFHLTSIAYEDVPCPQCRLPADPLEFAAAVPGFEPPAMMCSACHDRGCVRSPRTDDVSIANAKRVKYWDSVLDDYIRCCKIKAAAADANQAYLELETANRHLLIKFGSERQTELEGDDALQGVRQGIVDAAIRFDPTRKEGAAFSTVAYNWCRRNSRARQNGQKRAGKYAQSTDAMVNEDGVSVAWLIQDREGALGTFNVSTSANPSLVLDLREKLAALPDQQRSVMQFELVGMGTSEIAQNMTITKVKVRKLRELAFESLRAALSGYASVRALDD